MKFEYNIKSELQRQLSEVEKQIEDLKDFRFALPWELTLKMVEDATDESNCLPAQQSCSSIRKTAETPQNTD